MKKKSHLVIDIRILETWERILTRKHHRNTAMMSVSLDLLSFKRSSVLLFSLLSID